MSDGPSADGRKVRTANPGIGLTLFTIPEAADVLRVPVGWLRKKVTAGAVPHTRLGKHVRFSADHLRLIVIQGQPAATTATATESVHGLSPRARRRPID